MRLVRLLLAAIAIPVVLLLTSCEGYSLKSFSDRSLLVGTWIAGDLPGQPTVTFVDAPFYADDTLEHRYDGRVTLTGWPAEIFQPKREASGEGPSWGAPKDWTGEWEFTGPILKLSLSEAGETNRPDRLGRAYPKVILYLAPLSINCVNAYNALSPWEEGGDSVRLCKTW